MEKKLKIGIIGCGGIANGKHMPSLKGLSDIEMVAFCDIIEERAEKAAKDYGTADAKVYTDYKELIKDSSIEVIHVCTPNKSHAEISIASMKAGKHVMCEKPMAKTAAEAVEMVKAAKETGKKLTVGYQHRFKQESTYLKSVVDSGRLGDIYYAKALAIRRRGTPNWGVFLNAEEQGGGPIIDIGTHSLDLTLWMMNNYKPKMVVGTTYKKIEGADQGNPWGGWEDGAHTLEDSSVAFIVMEDGSTVTLDASWAINIANPIQEGSCMLHGVKSGAEIINNVVTLNGVEFDKQYVTTPDCSAGGVAFYEGADNSPQAVEARMWIDCIKNDTDPLVTPEQACVVSQILEAIYVSAKTGEPFYFNK